jgi:hypothetical protein
MTNEQIAKMIVIAYNEGRSDGHEEGYKEGYDKGYEEGYERADSEGDQTAFDNGYEKGYEAAREDFEVVVEVDEDEGEDKVERCPPIIINNNSKGEDEGEDEKEWWSSEQWYDAGWNDGYSGDEPDEEMKEDRVYMWGYRDGAKEEEEEDEGEEEDEACMASSLAYDLGWNDGNTGEAVDEEMKHDRVYMWGYKNGKKARK